MQIGDVVVMVSGSQWYVGAPGPEADEAARVAAALGYDPTVSAPWSAEDDRRHRHAVERAIRRNDRAA